MKKSIFIIAALFAATFANAQITLLHTFQGTADVTANIHYGNTMSPNYGYIESPYWACLSYEDGEYFVQLYDKEDFSLYKSISIDNDKIGNLSLVFQNILTTDGKVCFGLAQYGGPTFIFNEDGLLITTLNGMSPHIAQVNGNYFLITRADSYGGATYVYSLPGNGVATETQEVSSPRQNARKYISNDQVLIESNDKTFTVQGQEVK